MVFSNYAIDKIIDASQDFSILPLARKNESDFTRKGKIKVWELILFNLNKQGLTLKMEIDKFTRLLNLPEISSPGMLDRRRCLNPEVFKHLNSVQMKGFYTQFRDEVKTFNGHAILAIDGSDGEIPNTPEARRTFGQTLNGSAHPVARMKISSCFDVLNHFVLDTEVEGYKFSERTLANRHISSLPEIIGGFPCIVMMDRGYASLSNFFQWEKNGVNFIVRVPEGDFRPDREAAKSDDEWIDIRYQYDRVRYYLKSDPALYGYYQNGGTVKVRTVTFLLPTGQTEVLFTNLSSAGFSRNDILGLYDMRWGVESNYHSLKESLKITNISSSIEDLVKQEVYSQVIVFNLASAVAREETMKIDQGKYRYLMKVNMNLAIGQVKDLLIHIMVEENPETKQHLFDELHRRVFKNKIQIRPGRRFARKKGSKNKYPVTKRKAF